MKYTTSCKNTNNSEAIKEKLSDVLGRLDKYFPGNKSCTAKVRLETKDRNVNPAKVEISIGSGKSSFRAEASAENHFTAIDECFDKLNKQLRRYKNKRIDSKRNFEKLSIPANPVEKLFADYSPSVAKVKSFELKFMSIEEAIKEMDTLGHEFFIFLDVSTETTSVVYNRSDGTYGVIHTC